MTVAKLANAFFRCKRSRYLSGIVAMMPAPCVRAPGSGLVASSNRVQGRRVRGGPATGGGTPALVFRPDHAYRLAALAKKLATAWANSGDLSCAAKYRYSSRIRSETDSEPPRRSRLAIRTACVGFAAMR